MKQDVIKQAFDEIYMKENTSFYKFYELKNLLKTKYCLDISKGCLLSRVKQYINR